MSYKIGTLNITKLNGFSSHSKGALKKLVYTIDCWIEDNYTIPTGITISDSFMKKVINQLGIFPNKIETIVGTLSVNLIKNKKHIIIVEDKL